MKLKTKILLFLFFVWLAAISSACNAGDYCWTQKGFVQSGSGYHQNPPKNLFK